MLIICPVRPGDSNEELRYAIRSWEKNLILPGGLDLMTVGYKPKWLDPDVHLEGNRYKSMPLAVFDNILLASEAAAADHYGDHDEPVIYMNDDFFCLDPVGKVLPVKRNCSLEQHVAKFPENAALWWPKSLRLTASWLAEAGFPHPDSYEVHRPLPAAPGAMFEALSRWDGGMEGTIPQWRTMYGVLNKVDAYPVADVKISLSSIGQHSPWLSTSDQSWRRVMGRIKASFQKPSRWEIG